MPVNNPVSAQPSNTIHTLGILSVIFAFIFPLVGLILSLVGRSKAKRARLATGQLVKTTLLTVGLICSIVFLALYSLLFASLIPELTKYTFSTDKIVGNWDCTSLEMLTSGTFPDRLTIDKSSYSMPAEGAGSFIVVPSKVNEDVWRSLESTLKILSISDETPTTYSLETDSGRTISVVLMKTTDGEDVLLFYATTVYSCKRAGSNSAGSGSSSTAKDYTQIIIGDWGCSTGDGIIMDDNGNFAGTDYSNITRQYEFGSDGTVYGYMLSSKYTNYLHATYSPEAYTASSNGFYKASIMIHFIDFVVEGERRENLIDTKWELVVNPSDPDTIGLMAGGDAFQCMRRG
jgi:hypothetical protein